MSMKSMQPIHSMNAPHASLLALCAAALGAALLLATSAGAFSPDNALDSLGDREREVFDAIAARDADLRDAALLATLYPDTLVHIELIQARSSAAFELRAKQLDREHQEELWELVRAEGALADIVDGGPKSEAQLKTIAAEHPERIRAIFGHLGSEHFETLQEAQAIRASADIEFDNELAGLPEVPRDAFRQLLTDPGLLAMLGRSPSAVRGIGDAFDADPEATLARLDELALEVAENNAQSEETWRESFDDDPDAQAELEVAARTYADEYGYDYDDLTDREVEVNVHVYQHSYPYWFGYPQWYASLDPWGVWYPVRPHLGFYYGQGSHRPSVFFGLPSLHFVSWFYGGHYNHYPSLYRHIDNHHSRHVRAYRPLHRYARLHHHRRGQRDRRWAPARLTPRAVHAEHRRVERRERGVERRETRRSHMATRRDTQRTNGIERRSVRRETGEARRDTRRDNMGERREQRRERASERKSERTQRTSDRERPPKAAPRERRSQRGTSVAPRVETRSVSRDAIHGRMDTRRDARASRVVERTQKASARSNQRRAKAEARASSRTQARTRRLSTRSVESRTSQRVARAQVASRVTRPTRENAVSQQRSRPTRARAVSQQRSRPTRERASSSASSRPSRERGAQAVRKQSRPSRSEPSASSRRSGSKSERSSGKRGGSGVGRRSRR